MTIEIRAYTPADLDRVMMVWRAATVIAHPFQGRVELDRDEDLIRNQYMNLTESWCAWERVRLAGFISLRGTRIVALFVDPACQRGGIGGRLLAHAIERQGPLSVEVFQENRIGVQFYEKHGFEFVREEPIPMYPGHTQWVMAQKGA